MFFVYILRCSDGSYYVGHTEDVDERVHVHQSGRGSTFTTARIPVELLYTKPFEQAVDAIRRERQLKRWTRAKKAALIAGDKSGLRELSASRQSTRQVRS